MVVPLFWFILKFSKKKFWKIFWLNLHQILTKILQFSAWKSEKWWKFSISWKCFIWFGNNSWVVLKCSPDSKHFISIPQHPHTYCQKFFSKPILTAWEAIFAETLTGYCIFSRAFWAPILLACEAFVPQLSIYVHTFQIYAKIGASWTNFKVKFFHWNFNQIFDTLKNWTFWHTLTSKLVKMVMPQYIEGGFMFFSKIHDPHLHISDRILWLRSFVKVTLFFGNFIMYKAQIWTNLKIFTAHFSRAKLAWKDKYTPLLMPLIDLRSLNKLKLTFLKNC